jgi:hypothetical protein
MKTAILATVAMTALTAYSGVLRAQNSTVTLPGGTKVIATLDKQISSSSTKIGDTVSATINSDVKDANGQVVFPTGSKAEVRVLDIKGADATNKQGTLALAVTDVRANGQVYHLATGVDSLAAVGQKPGWTSDKKKIGIGAAAGAVVGGLLGGNLRSAIIGGILGAAGGATVAHEMNGNELVVKSGTTVTFPIQQPVQVMVSMS